MQVISRWHALVDNFSTSALDFYTAVEQAVQERQVPEARTSRVEFKEGDIASAKREYLRVQRGKVAFDIGAAPFGTGYFFSWWMVRLGPPHPWIWLVAAIGAFLLWCFILLSSFSAMVATSFSGRSGGSGCFFLVVLVSLPAAVIGLGWSVREGYVGDEDVVLATPIVGWLYERLFNPQTYYRFDTALMFQESVSRAVNEVLNGLLEAQGLRALSADALKPTIRDLAR